MVHKCGAADYNHTFSSEGNRLARVLNSSDRALEFRSISEVEPHLKPDELLRHFVMRISRSLSLVSAQCAINPQSYAA